MPVLTIYGMPPDLKDSSALTHLVLEELPRAVAAVEELGVKPGQVTAFVPSDLVNEALGEEIIVFIEGLWMRKERTPEVRQRLADAVLDCMRRFAEEHVFRCEMIEVIPRSQRPEDGFADWRKEPVTTATPLPQVASFSTSRPDPTADIRAFQEQVQSFAREALTELRSRLESGERQFTIERRFDRSACREDGLGRYVRLNWFQRLFYDIVDPVWGMQGVEAYADYASKDADSMEEDNTMVYRLSVA